MHLHKLALLTDVERAGTVGSFQTHHSEFPLYRHVIRTIDATLNAKLVPKEDIYMHVQQAQS